MFASLKKTSDFFFKFIEHYNWRTIGILSDQDIGSPDNKVIVLHERFLAPIFELKLCLISG